MVPVRRSVKSLAAAAAVVLVAAALWEVVHRVVPRRDVRRDPNEKVGVDYPSAVSNFWSSCLSGTTWLREIQGSCVLVR